MASGVQISLTDICGIPPLGVFATNGRLGWVPSTNCGRSTSGLLYSCLYTIFLCVWSAVHPNVSKTTDSWSRIYLNRLGWLLLALFAPESVAAYSIGEFYQAIILRRFTKRKFHGSAWPLKYCFFARSGGIVVNEGLEERALKTLEEIDTEIVRRGTDMMAELPKLWGKDLSDKVKSGPLLKLLAISQICWFAAEVIARHEEFKQDSRNITTLEIMTAGIIVCTLIQYFFWWAKPQGVYYPIILGPSLEFTAALSESANPNKHRTIHEPEQPEIHSLVNEEPRILPPKSLITIKQLITNILEKFLAMYRLDTNEQRSTDQLQVFISSLFATIVFGGLNLVAWNFSFPTQLESLLWRVSCVGMLILPVSFAALAQFWEFRGTTVQVSVMALIGFSYGVIRLYVIVECFLALRSEPAHVYCAVDWSDYFPHI